MIDPITTQRLFHQGVYIAIAMVILFVQLMPLSPSAGHFPGPDLTLALTLAWVLRRPEYVPALSIVAIFLLQDMMFMRPPGLWTLLVLVGSEFLRARESSLRDLPFVLEWLVVAGVLCGMVLANRLVHALVMIPQPGLGTELLRMLMTLLAYPVVVAATRFGVGLKRAAIGEVDALGHRR